MGRNPDAGIETMHMQVREKSLNLLDFERNREVDLFMIDVNSDRSEYGGVSETELAIMQDKKDGDTYRKCILFPHLDDDQNSVNHLVNFLFSEHRSKT